MAFSYNKKNLANTTITGAITPTQTSVTVADATVFSYAFFYATLMPSNEMSNASNSEIVLVTNIQGNTLTLVRGQENTIARSFPYGAVITNGIYTRDIDYARSIGRKVFMARDDGTDDTNTSYQIIDPMIKNVPEEGSIITVEFDTPSYGAPTLGVNNGIGGLVQVSGTDIHITDSSGQIDSVEMYGDTQQQTYSGKNKLTSISHLVSSDNGITVSLQSDGSIKATGTVGSSWNGFNLAFYSTDTIASGQYTFSIDHSISSAIAVAFRTSDNTNLGNITIPAGSTSATGTISGTIGKSSLWVSANTGTSINFTIKAQLESGSSATSFEPYVGGTASPNPDYPQEVQTVTGRQVVTVTDGDSQSQEYEINLGKNLLDIYYSNPIGYSYTTNGVTFTLSEDGGIKMSGTGTGSNANFEPLGGSWADTQIRIPLDPTKTYMSSITRPSNAYRWYLRGIVNGEVTTLNSNNDTVLIQNCTGITYALFQVVPNASVSGTAYPQIELGSTATTYAPYFTPIELCKIGDYQDKIYKSGDDWYVHKDIKKRNLVDYKDLAWWLSGTHVVKINWQILGDSDFVTPVNIDSAGVMVSNYFTNTTGRALYDGTTLVGCAIGNDGLYFSNNDWSVSDFKTFITNNPVFIYNALATPTDTKITNATLISELDALYNMLPEGVADVVVTGDLPGSLTIKYYQQGTGTYTAPIVGGAEIDGGDNEQVVELDSYLPYRLVYDTNGYWRVLNKGPKVTTGAIMDGAVTAAKITRDNINYGTTSSDIRIGTFDGKPLWRRVQKFTNIPTGYSVHNWTAGTIANLSSIVAVNGMFVASGSTTYVPINSLPPDAVTTYGIAIRDFTASSWAVVLGTSMSTVNSGYIILDYTKTS